jgi:hypothetical protein
VKNLVLILPQKYGLLPTNSHVLQQNNYLLRFLYEIKNGVSKQIVVYNLK